MEAVLGKLGFDKNWINWTMESVRSVSYFLVINGKSTPRFCPSRGIRQEDPLLPYLFLFMVDVLSRMVQKQAQTRILEGLKVSKNCPLLTHLFFADDSLFFLKANTGNCRRLVECIQRYCTASG